MINIINFSEIKYYSCWYLNTNYHGYLVRTIKINHGCIIIIIKNNFKNTTARPNYEDPKPMKNKNSIKNNLCT